MPAAELTVDDVVRSWSSRGFGNDFVPQGFGELLGAGRGRRLRQSRAGRGFLVRRARQARSSALLERLQGRRRRDARQWLDTGNGRRSPRTTEITETATAPARRHLGWSGCSRRWRQVSPCSDARLDRQEASPTACSRSIGPARPRSSAGCSRPMEPWPITARSRNTWHWTALAWNLLRQVQLLLLGFGIKAKLYENRLACARSEHGRCLPDGKGGAKSISCASRCIRCGSPATVAGRVRAARSVSCRRARRPNGWRR